MRSNHNQNKQLNENSMTFLPNNDNLELKRDHSMSFDQDFQSTKSNQDLVEVFKSNGQR